MTDRTGTGRQLTSQDGQAAGRTNWWEEALEADNPYEKALAPNRIKSHNWARRYKRNKKLWKSTRSGGTTASGNQAAKLREALGG